MTTFDTSPSARHRRMRLALQTLKRYDHTPGHGPKSRDLRNPQRRQRVLTHLAHDVLIEEQRHEERGNA